MAIAMAAPVQFVKPMEALAVSKLPEGDAWSYELKVDGYRLQAVKRGGITKLMSRRESNYSSQFPTILTALKDIPDGTVIDGELAALDDMGKPRLNLLQNYRSRRAPIVYFPFDIMFYRGTDVMDRPLSERRSLLREVCRESEYLIISVVMETLPGILEFVRSNDLEGVIGKRRDSAYEPGRRSGKWQKMRISLGQEFVIGGYIPSELGVDSMVVGYYKENKLQYAGRVRAGLVPASRRQIAAKLQRFISNSCPFVDLPERSAGVWGAGLTREKMAQVIWLRPEVVAQIEFLEWTEADRLRHASFVALRDDKKAREIVKES